MQKRPIKSKSRDVNEIAFRVVSEVTGGDKPEPRDEGDDIGLLQHQNIH